MEEKINIEKRNKIKRWGTILFGSIIGLMSIKSTLADIYLGQNNKQETHIWKEATYPGTITRDGNNNITSMTITKPVGNDVISITRDVGGKITKYESVYDGLTKTVTITRDGNGFIESWSVT